MRLITINRMLIQKLIGVAILLYFPLFSFSQFQKTNENCLKNKKTLVSKTKPMNSAIDRALNDPTYLSLPNDSVYKPELIPVSNTDSRVKHLLDREGTPINPTITNNNLGRFKDGNNNNKNVNLNDENTNLKNAKNKTSQNLTNLSFDNIDFVEIENKVYYRLHINEKNLSKYIPEKLIDFENYPGYILLEIQEDIKKIANKYLDNGADSVKIINENNIRIYKPFNQLDANDRYENMQLSNKRYPGYFTYVRLEPGMYLPLKNAYPNDLTELKGKRSTNSRHFVSEDGNIDAFFTIRPTAIPILPENVSVSFDELSYDQKRNLKWIELPACYPVPTPIQNKDVYTITYDETYYGHSVYCTNDETYPYVWICSPLVNYLGTIGSMEDDDWLSGDEHNYNRIHDKFTISTIPDDATVTAAEYQTFLPDIPPYTTGDCDGLLDWEEVWPESKDMYNNMTSTHDIHHDGEVDMFSNTWYNDVEGGTVYYLANGWDWNRNDGYTNFDVSFNANGLADIESRLAGNWYVVGIADKDENNQSPTFWQAVATYNLYSSLRISYVPCCDAPDNVVAYANGATSTTVCPGENINLTFNNSTGGGCSCGTWRYAWSNGSAWWNGSSFSSGSPVYNSSYNSINTSISNNTNFTLRMECDYCGDYTASSVQVNAFSNSTNASSINGTGAICPGNNASLSVNGGSLGTSANWIWYSSSCGGTQVGTGNSISVSPSSATTYYVRAEGLCNNTSCVSGTVTLHTESSPATSANASPATIIPGNSSTLSISGGSLGSGATWRWYTGSCGGTYVGTGTSISVSPTVNTTYFVRAEGTCNNTECVSVTVFVEGSVTICPGDIARLSINGGSLGTGASWHWYSSNCGVGSVGTGASLDVSPSSTTTYFARAEGTCNTTGCASMQVIVNTESTNPTSISASNSDICVGGSSTLTVNGGSLGTGASWQWYSGSCGGTFLGTGTSITVNPTSTTNYYVRAEGDCNLTSCVSRTINVAPDPTASINSSTTEVCSGGTVSFTQTTSGGSGTITNQWQTSTDGVNWNNWTTSTNPTTGPLTENTIFRLVRSASSNGCNDGISNTILIDVFPDPIITLQPTSPDPICVGGTTNPISTSASGGTGSFNYQWQYNNGGSWSNVSNGSPAGATYTGATTNSFTASGFSNAGIYEYQCVISQSGNGCNQITTNSINVTVEPDPSINIVGAATICSGGIATLLASENGGTGTYTYQWQNSSDGSSWTNIGGATNPTYTTPALASTMYYQAIVNASGSGCNPATSNSQAITIVPDPTISTHPTGATICAGATHSMSVNASGGTPSLTYQWQSSSDNSTWNDIVGATSSNYTTPILTSQTYYRVIVDAGGSACDGVISNTATVSIYDALQAGTISAEQTICNNTVPSTLTGTMPSGGDGTYAYQWQSSTNCTGTWTDIPGATSANYSPGTLSQTTCYRRMVSDDNCGIAYSTPISINTDLLLHFNFDDAQEPTTNIIANPNGTSISNETPGNYQPGWDVALHSDAITVNNWSGGYNGGVSSPATGYHGRWVYNGIDGATDPCMLFQDENNTYGLGHRWLGISQSVGTLASLGISHGDVLTVSWYQKSNVANKGARVGLYHKLISSGSNSFESNIATINVQNTGVWERVSYSTTVGTNWDLNQNFSIYVYGNSGAYGKLWVDKVQVEKKNNATPFVSGSRATALVTDYSGDENHGTIETATSPTWIASGINGGAYDFDGSNDYIIIDNDFVSSPTSLTISSWFKKNGDGDNYECVLHKSSNTSIGASSFWLGLDDTDKLTATIGANTGVGWAAGQTSIVANTGEWYHLAASWDGSVVKVYINGEYNKQYSLSSYTDLSTPTRVGASSDGANYQFNGTVDEVRIYNRALTASEVESLFSSTALQIEVQSPVTEGTISENQTICSGGDPAIINSTIDGSGDGAISYRWESAVSPFSAWSTISGATGATYNPPSGLTETTQYRRITISTLNGIDCESVPTTPIQVTVLDDPTWATNTVTPTAVCAGGQIDFSASVSGGSGGTISWIRSNTSGGSGSNITSPYTESSAGTYYYRPIYNATVSGCNLNDGAESTISVFADPTVGTPTFTNTIICSGGSTVASTTVSGGTGTLNYQWQYNNSGSWENVANGTPSGATYSGATTTSLTISGTTETGTHQYRLRASNSLGCDTYGNGASYTLTADPSWATNTVSPNSICTGGQVTFNASISGGSGGTINWIRATSSGAGGTNVSSPHTELTAGTYYYRPTYTATVSGCNLSDGTEHIVDVVADPTPPTATKSPNLATVCEGTTLTLVSPSAGSGGTGSCGFEYQYSTDGVTYSSWSSSVSSFAAVPGTNLIRIRQNCNGNGCDPSNYNEYSWIIDEASDGGTASADPSTAICAGESVELNLTGYNGDIQWQTDESGSWVNISGATANTYNTPILANSTSYQAIVTNGVCSANNSNTVLVNVTTPDVVGISGNDYIWTGATSTTWDGSTTNNWIKFNSGTEFEIPADVPNNADNVFIRSSGTCFTNPPVVNTMNVAECNDLTIDSGNTLNINTGSNIKIFGDLNNHGSLNVTGNSPIEIYGNWNNYNSFSPGNGTVSFMSTTQQSITSNNDPFYKLNINNNNGGDADIILIDDLKVTNEAIFTNGIITTNANTFIFGPLCSTNEGNTNSFIDGFTLKESLSTSFTFPTGNVNTRDIGEGNQTYKIWAPIKTNPVSTTNVFVRYYFSNDELHPWWYHDWTHETPLTHTSGREYWLVNAGHDLNVTLYWKNNNPCLIHDFCYPGPTDFDPTALTIAYWDGIWIDAIGTASSNYENGEIVASTNIPFGAKNETQITFGGIKPNIPLPVELVDFNVICDNANALLTWTTASEFNNDYFIIEKSKDATNWIEIAKIQGAGTSNTERSYSYLDNNLFTGENYYRLKQVDFDGTVTTFKTLSINCDKYQYGVARVLVFPNPFQNDIKIFTENIMDEEITFEIFDELGKLVHTKTVHRSNNPEYFDLNLERVKPGMYFLRTKSNSHLFNIEIIKQ